MSDRYEHYLRQWREGITAKQAIAFHRFYRISGIIAAIMLVLLLIGIAAKESTIAWIRVQFTDIFNPVHIHEFPLDRLDPTCPQCM